MAALSRSSWSAVALSTAVFAAVAAFATTAAHAADNELGPYTIAAADGQLICKVSLDTPPEEAKADAGDTATPVPGKLTVEADCAATFAEFGSVAGWVREGGAQITLVNEAGEPVVLFQDIGGGVRVGRFETGGIAYLASDREEVAASENETAGGTGGPGIAGAWTFTRGPDGTTPVCRVTLAQAAAGEGLAALTPDDDCGEAIRVLELAGWKLDGEVLSVHDASGRLQLSFTQQDGPVWIRNPEGSRPLFFIRRE